MHDGCTNEDTANLPIEQRGNPDLILNYRLSYLLEGQTLRYITPMMSFIISS